MIGSSTKLDEVFDYALVGGGLQNCLIALALLRQQPRARFVLLERGERLGGNHLWCLHAADVPQAARELVDPLIVARWPRYEVRFTNFGRVVDDEYAAVSSDRLHEVVTRALETHETGHIEFGANVASVGAQQVELADSRIIRARLVVDARGPERLPPSPAAYQKFVGLELRVARGTAPECPVLMDACVPQVDGFRFFYVIPLSPTRVLVEDTYFSDSPDLNQPAIRSEIFAYAANSGIKIEGVERAESGVLPLPLERMPAATATMPLRAGYAGGWFHPTTGYSFPVALRLATFLAERNIDATFGSDFTSFVRVRDRQLRFCLLLNRLLYRACSPVDRWQVLQRFYTLPTATIRRFYALDTTHLDRARIVCGKPPRGVTVRSALTQGILT